MFSRALQIAVTKAHSEPSRAALLQALEAADALHAFEATFEERVNASKAARGEKPTRLPRSRQAQLDSYADDALVMEREQLVHFQAVETPVEIARALAAALESDVAFWRTAGRYAHPDEAPLIAELLQLKYRLLDALRRCTTAA